MLGTSPILNTSSATAMCMAPRQGISHGASIMRGQLQKGVSERASRGVGGGAFGLELLQQTGDVVQPLKKLMARWIPGIKARSMEKRLMLILFPIVLFFSLSYWFCCGEVSG
jgi:hypothetical protein